MRLAFKAYMTVFNVMFIISTKVLNIKITKKLNSVRKW